MRNTLYDCRILKSRKADVKTIVVGNISVGGTGKTPHTIWLAEELSKACRVAVLSRGYKRKSRGFRWINPDDNPAVTGDEPLEIKRQLPGIPVAVDSNRLRGVSKIKEEMEPNPDMIILDDGFQHRKLIPDFSIILSDFYRPFDTDILLPAGRLREPRTSAGRADAIIITDSPSDTGKGDIRINKKTADEQLIISSSYRYGKYEALNDKARQIKPEDADAILFVAGIARQLRLKEEFGHKGNVEILLFPDHKDYNERDIDRIIKSFEGLKGEIRIMVTTGKDAVKLNLFPEIQEFPLFCLKRDIVIEKNDKKLLIDSILLDS